MEFFPNVLSDDVLRHGLSCPSISHIGRAVYNF